MAEKKEPKVTKGNIKNGTIELVLLLLLRSEKKYGYQLANELLEYIFKSKDEFVLLINCSAGSSYEHFMDDLVGEVERQSVNFLKYLRKKGYPCPDISKEELHILISAQYYAIFEIVRHDIPKKKAIKRIRLIIDFFRPGWKNIFGQ